MRFFDGLARNFFLSQAFGPKEYFVYFESRMGRVREKDPSSHGKDHTIPVAIKNRTLRRSDVCEISNPHLYVCRRIWHHAVRRLPGFIGPFPPPLLIRLVCSSRIFYCIFTESQELFLIFFKENVNNSAIDIFYHCW